MAKLGNIESMLAMDQALINSLSREQLAPIVTRMNDVANRRLKRLAKSDTPSPAAKYIQRTGGFEGVRGKSLIEIRNEYQRVKRFLTAKTSTVRGAKEYKKETFARTAKAINVTTAELEESLSETQKKRFWRVIDRAADSGILTKAGKEFYRVREILAKEISGGNKRRGVDRLYDVMFNEKTGLYKAARKMEALAEKAAEKHNLMSSFYD